MIYIYFGFSITSYKYDLIIQNKEHECAHFLDIAKQYTPHIESYSHIDNKWYALANFQV